MKHLFAPNSRMLKIHAHVAHVKQLYDTVKYAYKLNDKVLNPCTLEKTSAQLADSLFPELTINALIHFSKHGYPEFFRHSQLFSNNT